jgi:hypothetical protein
VLAAIEGGGYGLFDARSFRRRTEFCVGGRFVDAFVKAELIERRGPGPVDPRPTHFVITEPGRAFLARAMAGDVSFVEENARPPAPGIFTPRLVVNRRDSPLDWLKTRKGIDGAAFLSAAEAAAATHLREDFTHALLAPGAGSHWPQERVDMSRRVDQSPTELAQGAEAAKSRFWHAIDAVGPELAPVVIAVACHLQSLESVEASMRLPARSAKSLLKAGLCSLARHYGLAAATPRSKLRVVCARPLPAD